MGHLIPEETVEQGEVDVGCDGGGLGVQQPGSLLPPHGQGGGARGEEVAEVVVPGQVRGQEGRSIKTGKEGSQTFEDDAEPAAV